MCWWGKVFVFGFNINVLFVEFDYFVIFEVLQKICELCDGVMFCLQVYIDVFFKCYGMEYEKECVVFDKVYVDVMCCVVYCELFDLIVVMFFVEVFMDMLFWDYWFLNGELKVVIEEFIQVFEIVLCCDVMYLGVVYLFIYVVEKVRFEFGVFVVEMFDCSEQVMGYFVYMVLYIYMCVGCWDDLVCVN